MPAIVNLIMVNQDLYTKMVLQCHEKAFHIFGHGYIFDMRAKRYGRWVNLIKVFGIIVPAAIGATALGYGYNNAILKAFISIAIPVTIVQFVFSVFAVIYKWDDELSYAFEASQDYNSLYRRFDKLGKFPSESLADLNIAFDLLDTEFNSRTQQDTKHNVSEKELRQGMRYSLREHKRECYGCKTIPTSMKPTDCNVCGNF